MQALDPSIKKTAVVVKPSIEQIRQIEAAGFDYIQIHGMIDPALFSQIRLPVLKAFNVKDMDTIADYRLDKNVAGYVL